MKSISTLLSCLLLCLLSCPLASAAAFRLPAFEEVRASHISSDAVLLDRKGLPLASLRINPQVRRLDWVPLTALSPAMRDALLRAEDRRFFQHGGVDWLAFAGAAWQNLWGHGKRGASTLTMQLAGLLDPALHMPANRRSMSQKWDQSRAAIELEEKWSKPQILEAYLNLAPFRGDLQGIGAASELIFQLPAQQLSLREASLLAALLRGPNASPALVARRACVLAKGLGQTQQCPQITRLAQSRLSSPRNRRIPQLAPHLARQLLKQAGQRQPSLLDANLQARLLSALETSAPGSALIVLDNSNAEVLAWIGNTDPQAGDGVLLPRPSNDWWWPWAAALAIEQGEAHAASPLPLKAVIFDANDARAAPTSWLSLRAALNAHQPAALLGLHARQKPEIWLARLSGLGFEHADSTPPAPQLLQLATAWRSFAASGNWQAARWLPTAQIRSSRPVWQAGSAWILQQLLGSQGGHGWEVHWQAHNTADGSTLLIGNTEHHTLALATHTARPEALWQVLLRTLNRESRAPAMPDGVVRQSVSFDPPLEETRQEVFLAGTALDLVSMLPQERIARILFPPAGTHALQTPGQRWLLHAESRVALHWQLDHRPLGDALRLLWQPTAGKHHLSIRDPQDRELDSVDFEILSAEPPPPSPDPRP